MESSLTRAKREKTEDEVKRERCIVQIAKEEELVPLPAISRRISYKRNATSIPTHYRRCTLSTSDPLHTAPIHGSISPIIIVKALQVFLIYPR